MKKGMILVAKDPCLMQNFKKEALVVGKEYPILEVHGDSIVINSEFTSKHWFSFDIIGHFFHIDTPETDPFQEFFSFMSQTHGLILTNGEMWDIVNEVEKLKEKLKS